MRQVLLDAVVREEARAIEKWGAIDTYPTILLNASVEELGEVAHAINHDEGSLKIQREIAECIGILSRLHDRVEEYGRY